MRDIVPPGNGADGEPDVLVDVPQLEVEEIDLEVTDLRARVSLSAEMLNLLRLNVGVDAELGHVRLDVKGVQARALLKVRLEQVTDIVNRVLETIDSHPEIIRDLNRNVGPPAGQLGRATGQLGQQALPRLAGELGQTGREAVGPATDTVAVGPATDTVKEGTRKGLKTAQPAVEAGSRVAREGGGVTERHVEADTVDKADTIDDKADTVNEDTADRNAGQERDSRQERSRHRGLPRRARRQW